MTTNVIIRYVDEDEVEEIIDFIGDELGLMAETVEHGDFV